VWDNNRGRDFHTAMAVQIDRADLEDEIYKNKLMISLEEDSETATLSGVPLITQMPPFITHNACTCGY
jgi:hypothetical protein